MRGWRRGLAGRILIFVVLAKVGTWGAIARICQNQEFSGLAGFSGFRFAPTCGFRHDGNLAKRDMGAGLQIKDKPAES